MTEEQQRSKANIYHSRIRVDIGPSPFRRLSGGDVGTKILSAPEKCHCANIFAAFRRALTQGVSAPSVWQPGVHFGHSYPPSQLQPTFTPQQQPQEQKSRIPMQ